mgnify:CR=1 FL=1
MLLLWKLLTIADYTHSITVLIELKVQRSSLDGQDAIFIFALLSVGHWFISAGIKPVLCWYYSSTKSGNSMLSTNTITREREGGSAKAGARRREREGGSAKVVPIGE